MPGMRTRMSPPQIPTRAGRSAPKRGPTERSCLVDADTSESLYPSASPRTEVDLGISRYQYFQRNPGMKSIRISPAFSRSRSGYADVAYHISHFGCPSKLHVRKKLGSDMINYTQNRSQLADVTSGRRAGECWRQLPSYIHAACCSSRQLLRSRKT